MTTELPLPALIRADKARADRVKQYQTNRRYYDGQHTFRQPLKNPRPIARNFVGLFVDTAASHMGSPTISWAAPGKNTTVWDDYVASAIEHNGGEQLLYDSELACSIDGDAAWKTTWNDRDGLVNVAQVDAATLWASGRPDDPRAIESVAQQYTMAPRDAPVMFPGRVVSLAKAITVTEEWSTERWRVWFDDTLMSDEPNPYGFIPYVIYPNVRTPGSVWGNGDPERLQPVQDRLNEAGWDKDKLMTLAGSIVVLQGVDGEGDIRVAPGVIWELPDAASATVLDMLQGNALRAHHEHMDEIRSVLHQLARVPEAALGDNTGTAPLSGAALAIKLQPLVRLVARKRLSRTAALQRLATHIVALGAKFGALADPPPGAPSVTWTDAIPSDRADDLSAAEAELRLGRSHAAVLSSIGVEDPAAELRTRAAENKALGETIDRTGPQPAPAAPAGS